MALELRQQLKLSQQLHMTPQLQQAIKLLQLSRLELAETVQRELLENPFLEEGFEENFDGEKTEVRNESTTEEVYDKELSKDADWEDYLGEFASTPRNLQSREFESSEDITPFEARYAEKPSLAGHLLWQLRLSSLTDKQKEIGQIIIGNLASSGYLRTDLVDIVRMLHDEEALQERTAAHADVEPNVSVEPSMDSEADGLKEPYALEENHIREDNVDPLHREPSTHDSPQSEHTSADTEQTAVATDIAPELLLAVEEVLQHIQFFDPVGVAARSPQECLMIQLRNLRYDRDPILVGLVTEHLEDLENKRYKPLLRKFQLTMEDLKEYLDIIQSLEPLPGASFGGNEPTFVSPDVFVYQYAKDFVIVLNDDGLPHLQLSSSLEEQNLEGLSEKDKDYCSEKMRAASWLIKSLYQRQRTLYKVVESIIKYQRPFFEQGVTQLAPLILKDIADDIGMHESTVSRITTSKYVATPHGTFELKFFFNSALELTDGSQVGSESVKALIKKFINDENSKSPLSDERLSEMLKDHLKVNIARRTVAKYRTAMGIESSSRRKQHF